jgi:hypothetical protein
MCISEVMLASHAGCILHLISLWKWYGVMEVLWPLELGFSYLKFAYSNCMAAHEFVRLPGVSVFILKIRTIIHNGCYED